ncbi:hypothetical protein DDZ18_12440 [Marinicauda salina]|uniref:Tetratricopeptide repeat protein n=1 Tax=Marinicauda salina TaxID=2135793 RepID=A0A2U2BRC9_9PROT|nr:tetratricopeptide repeat protein [Marinicauda salina]PWE16571.1 hypothetical protein DDZ18_12440 [Marinicauda salina]
MATADAMAALNEAARLFQAGDPDAARRLCETILRERPGEVEARHLRAMALGRLGRVEESAADFRKAADGHAQPHVILTNLGNMLRRAGRFEEAEQAYADAVAKAPEHVDALAALASVRFALGKHEAARAAADSVLARAPAHAGALNTLGLVAAADGRDDDALAAYGRALEARPGLVSALTNRGALLRRLGRLDDSLADLDAACRAAPAQAESWHQKANTLRTLGRIQDAKAAFTEALKRAPTRADIHSDYASMLWEAGESAGFLSTIDAVLTRSPEPGLCKAKARLALRAGRSETALKAAEDALKTAPDDPDGLALRGEIRRLAGDRPGGLDDLRRAHALAPEDFHIRHEMVEALLASGAFQEAAAALEGDAPLEHLQRHVALKTLAWRALDDPRYRFFCDYERFAAKLFIDTPAGYDSIEAFNADLAATIEELHATSAQPLDQTLFGGTQSGGRLWNFRRPAIDALRQSLMDAARRYVAALPDDPDHPFLMRKSADLKLTGAWSVRLFSGGGHVNHYHPAGWISASYYVQVPPEIGEHSRAGWLRLGESGVQGLDLPAEKWIRPEPGSAIFFPSYMWHGVEPFESDAVRVTAPFDLLPA